MNAVIINVMFFSEPMKPTEEIFFYHNCFVHPIFSSFGLWYFGHFSCMIFFSVSFRLAYLALQIVNKDYVIFSYFRNFVTKSDQKPKMG